MIQNVLGGREGGTRGEGVVGNTKWLPWLQMAFSTGLGSSKVLLLGTLCKILITWYLLVLDTLKFKYLVLTCT